MNDMGDGRVEVELLANGSGVRALKKVADGPAEQGASLAKRGGRFAACAHSLEHLTIRREELLDLVEVVSTGVSEQAKKQAEGWAYIRP